MLIAFPKVFFDVSTAYLCCFKLIFLSQNYFDHLGYIYGTIKFFRVYILCDDHHWIFDRDNTESVDNFGQFKHSNNISFESITHANNFIPLFCIDSFCIIFFCLSILIRTSIPCWIKVLLGS